MWKIDNKITHVTKNMELSLPLSLCEKCTRCKPSIETDTFYGSSDGETIEHVRIFCQHEFACKSAYLNAKEEDKVSCDSCVHHLEGTRIKEECVKCMNFDKYEFNGGK